MYRCFDDWDGRVVVGEMTIILRVKWFADKLHATSSRGGWGTRSISCHTEAQSSPRKYYLFIRLTIPLGLLSQLVIFGTASSSKTETCGSRTGSLARTETRDRGNIREKQKSCSNDGAWKMKLVVLASIYHRWYRLRCITCRIVTRWDVAMLHSSGESLLLSSSGSERTWSNDERRKACCYQAWVKWDDGLEEDCNSSWVIMLINR